MGCSRASHFSHVSASRLRVACRSPATNVRSVNGGWHGLAGWCFRRLPETGAGLWADDGGNSLSHAGSSFAAANLCLAELRSIPEIPGVAGLPVLLAAEAGGAALRRSRRPFQADQARRTSRRGRRVPAALNPLSVGFAQQPRPVV